MRAVGLTKAPAKKNKGKEAAKAASAPKTAEKEPETKETKATEKEPETKETGKED